MKLNAESRDLQNIVTLLERQTLWLACLGTRSRFLLLAASHVMRGSQLSWSIYWTHNPL